MKTLVSIISLCATLVGASAHGSEGDEKEKPKATTATKGEDVSLKKKEDAFKVSIPINLWQAWGYQRENPMISTSLYLFPSISIGKRHRIGAFTGMNIEYTQPDDGRRVYWYNTLLSYSYKFWMPQWGKHKVEVGGGAAVALPTDEGARNRGTMRMAFGPRISAAYNYKIFTASYSLAFRKFWNGSTTEQITVADSSQTPQGVDAQQPVVASSGRANINYDLFHVLGVNLDFTKKLYFATQLWIFNQTPYDIRNGTPEFTSPNAAVGAARDSYWMFGEVGYNFSKLFSLGLGFSLSASQLSPDSKRWYVPVNNFNNNFITYLSVTLSPSI